MAPPGKKKTKDSSERVRRNADDRISTLSDALLHHILSFLRMPDVIATSLLSRRWRYLWTSTPTLDFRSWDPEKISIALILFGGTTIRKFLVFTFTLDVATSLINSWIRFAVRHHVQELDLHFYEGQFTEDREDLYWLHPCLFTCGSIETLKLKICKLNLPTFVHLPILKTLELCHLELTDVEIKVLISGCPLLENMTLVGCKNKSNLNIFAPNLNLKRLRILEHMSQIFDETKIDIFAPYVLSLELHGFRQNNYIIKNLSSIASVSIEFQEYAFFNFHEEVDKLEELLRNLSHAKTIKLCDWCVQILGVRTVVDTSSLNLHATCLELKTGLSKWDYPGIVFLIRSSCHVESLIFYISEMEMDASYEPLDDWSDESSENCAKEDWRSLGLSLSCQFSNLKTIKIYGFMGSKNFSSEEHEHIKMDEFIERRENEVELVRFFLENSRNLDKMIISTTKATEFTRCAIQAELLLNLSKRLLVVPRASQNAEIVFS